MNGVSGLLLAGYLGGVIPHLKSVDMTRLRMIAYSEGDDIADLAQRTPDIETTTSNFSLDADILDDVMEALNEVAKVRFVMGHILERGAGHLIVKLFREPEGDDRDDEGHDFIVFLS